MGLWRNATFNFDQPISYKIVTFLRGFLHEISRKTQTVRRKTLRKIHEILSRLEQRIKLANLFRRLNITHSQFPEKYRGLFNEEREKFLVNYRDTSLHINENLTRELEALYGLTRELAYEQRDAKYITLALQILKTIVACNAVNAQEEVVEITPEDAKQLTSTAKTLTGQVKKESRQLEKIAKQN